MRINFVAISDSSMASHRFRINKPYELLLEIGHDVTIKQFPDSKAHINFFSKHIESAQILDWMERCKTIKVFDVCDDHFDREFGDYYKKACSLANVLTCTNERMQKRLRELFPDKPIYVFYDPINTEAGEPKWSDKPKIIWFGHTTNFGDALPWMQEIVNLGYDLTVVSNIDINTKDFTFVKYQDGWVEENLKNYDIVLLPQGNKPWMNMKSENRFVDALNAGCLVIFNNNILYEDLEPYGVCTDTDNIKLALSAYKNSNEKGMKDIISLGQEYVRHNFNDSKIKEQLKDIIYDGANATF